MLINTIESNLSAYIKDQLRIKKVTYKKLACLLNEQSLSYKHYTENALRSSISRGKVQSVDLILILKALGINKVDMSLF